MRGRNFLDGALEAIKGGYRKHGKKGMDKIAEMDIAYRDKLYQQIMGNRLAPSPTRQFIADAVAAPIGGTFKQAMQAETLQDKVINGAVAVPLELLHSARYTVPLAGAGLAVKGIGDVITGDAYDETGQSTSATENAAALMALTSLMAGGTVLSPDLANPFPDHMNYTNSSLHNDPLGVRRPR